MITFIILYIDMAYSINMNISPMMLIYLELILSWIINLYGSNKNWKIKLIFFIPSFLFLALIKHVKVKKN